MSDETTPGSITVLWFDSNGRGPDELRIRLHPFPPDMDGAIPAHLGLRISAGGLVIGAKDMLGGGFYMDRASTADLHRQLGEWLEANQ